MRTSGSGSLSESGSALKSSIPIAIPIPTPRDTVFALPFEQKSQVRNQELAIRNQESLVNPTPLVSVIVVNWNGMNFLPDCLSSLERQTWKNLEFIIVDNGSKDGSTEFIRSWTERVPNAQAIFLSRNSGFCEAKQSRIAKARGEWIALLKQRRDCQAPLD